MFALWTDEIYVLIWSQDEYDMCWNLYECPNTCNGTGTRKAHKHSSIMVHDGQIGIQEKETTFKEL